MSPAELPREPPREPAGAPRWAQEGRRWPNREASRFLNAGGLRWHVQVAGEGPDLLLLHGTGAATHSWADLLPLLARRFRVIAPDLPGHGFTEAPDDLSLPAMARAVAALLAALKARPTLVAGHSAGAAILLHMALTGQIAPSSIVSLNGALLPFGGLAGQLFSPLARLMVSLPPVPWFLSRQAQDQAVVEKLLRGTGSDLRRCRTAEYAALFRTQRHVGAALGMMAAWDLHGLHRALLRLKPALLLVVGAQDRMVPPDQARQVQALVPGARLALLPRLGHLAHEESPAEVADLIAAEIPLAAERAA